MSTRQELNDLDNRVNELVRLVTTLTCQVSELSVKVNGAFSNNTTRPIFDRLDRIEMNHTTGELKVSSGVPTSCPLPPVSTSGYETVAIVRMPGWQPLKVRQA